MDQITFQDDKGRTHQLLAQSGNYRITTVRISENNYPQVWKYYDFQNTWNMCPLNSKVTLDDVIFEGILKWQSGVADYDFFTGIDQFEFLYGS